MHLSLTNRFIRKKPNLYHFYWIDPSPWKNTVLEKDLIEYIDLPFCSMYDLSIPKGIRIGYAIKTAETVKLQNNCLIAYQKDIKMAKVEDLMAEGCNLFYREGPINIHVLGHLGIMFTYDDAQCNDYFNDLVR